MPILWFMPRITQEAVIELEKAGALPRVRHTDRGSQVRFRDVSNGVSQQILTDCIQLVIDSGRLPAWRALPRDGQKPKTAGRGFVTIC
jgi:hypothetical protein